MLGDSSRELKDNETAVDEELVEGTHPKLPQDGLSLLGHTTTLEPRGKDLDTCSVAIDSMTLGTVDVLVQSLRMCSLDMEETEPVPQTHTARRVVAQRLVSLSGRFNCLGTL